MSGPTKLVDPEIISKVKGAEEKKLNHVSLETLTLLVNTSRLKDLHEKTDKELKEITQRQGQVRTLQSLLKKINVSLSDSGELDISSKEDIKGLIGKAQEIGVDIVVPQGNCFKKEERERLVENIRMTMDDLNSRNDMQLQKINRLTNERYESYQLARTILKPLHEAKMQSARAAKN